MRHLIRTLFWAALLVGITGTLPAERAPDARCTDYPRVTAVESTGSELVWPRVGLHRGGELVVYGPAGVVYSTTFGVDAMPEYPLIDDSGAPLEDGSYVWQIRLKRSREGLTDPEMEGRRFLVTRGRFELRNGTPAVEPGRECVGHVASAVDGANESDYSALYDVSGNWTMTGNLGVGTDLPTHPIDVRKADGTARILVEESGTAANRILMELSNNGSSFFKFTNTFNGTAWTLNPLGTSFTFDALKYPGQELRLYDTGRLVITPSGLGSASFDLDANGNLTIAGGLTASGNLYTTGSITPGSSRELKEQIERLELREAAEALADLDPVTFRYKADREKDRKVGFIAEDVPELVATPDRKGVSSMDIVGVLTKVLQEQQRVVQDQQKALEDQEKALRDQQEEIAKLKAALAEIRGRLE